MNSAEMITDQGQTFEELLHSLTEKYRDYLQHPGSSCKIVLKEDGQPDSKVDEFSASVLELTNRQLCH